MCFSVLRALQAENGAQRQRERLRRRKLDELLRSEALTMLGAIVLVHLPAGFFLLDGVEFVLTLFGGTAALALAGPGAFSTDAIVARRRARS